MLTPFIRDRTELFGLSEQEGRLVELLGLDGRTRKEAASEMQVSVRTLENYLDRIRAKTRTRTICQALCRIFAAAFEVPIKQ